MKNEWMSHGMNEQMKERMNEWMDAKGVEWKWLENGKTWIKFLTFWYIKQDEEKNFKLANVPEALSILM